MFCHSTDARAWLARSMLPLYARTAPCRLPPTLLGPLCSTGPRVCRPRPALLPAPWRAPGVAVGGGGLTTPCVICAALSVCCLAGARRMDLRGCANTGTQGGS